MVEWHPRHLVRAVEWLLTVPGQPEPVAVIRLVRIRGRDVYRAVTWAPKSDGRELIGYFANGDEAAERVWRRYVAENASQHERASRTHGSRER